MGLARQSCHDRSRSIREFSNVLRDGLKDVGVYFVLGCELGFHLFVELSDLLFDLFNGFRRRRNSGIRRGFDFIVPNVTFGTFVTLQFFGHRRSLP